MGQQPKQLRQLLYITHGLTPMRQIKTAGSPPARAEPRLLTAWVRDLSLLRGFTKRRHCIPRPKGCKAGACPMATASAQRGCSQMQEDYSSNRSAAAR
jgi:hypothetical protein